jgi:tetratricopeptide (TPR) repeat protein
VFPVEAFDPAASAVRIGPELLVTNRHVVGDRETAKIFTPGGPREAEVIASAYRGDLALLQVSGLPQDGLVLDPAAEAALDQGPYFAVGADIARRQVRVFEPGTLIAGPAKGAPLGRIHVTARMQPGVSGGALVDDDGRLVGIAVGGGEGRFEALPAGEIEELLAARDAADAAAVQSELGAALVSCATAIDGARGTARGQPFEESVAAVLTGDCRTSENLGQFMEAGRLLGMAGDFDAAAALHEAAVAQVPNSISARISLLVSLQLAGRFQDMLPHARRLLELAPEDPQSHRFAIQAGVWGGDMELAEAAYRRLLEVDPRQAEAARRFIDDPPPAPPRR